MMYCNTFRPGINNNIVASIKVFITGLRASSARLSLTVLCFSANGGYFFGKDFIGFAVHNKTQTKE